MGKSPGLSLLFLGSSDQCRNPRELEVGTNKRSVFALVTFWKQKPSEAVVMGTSSCQGFGKERGRGCWGVSTLGGLSSPAPTRSQPLSVMMK